MRFGEGLIDPLNGRSMLQAVFEGFPEIPLWEVSPHRYRETRQWGLQRPKRFLHVEELNSLIAIEANLRRNRTTRMRIR
jgi:hypothetical protein